MPFVGGAFQLCTSLFAVGWDGSTNTTSINMFRDLTCRAFRYLMMVRVTDAAVGAP